MIDLVALVAEEEVMWLEISGVPVYNPIQVAREKRNPLPFFSA